MPPSRSWFFRLMPSTKTLTWLAVEAPEVKPLSVSLSLYFTPGASATKDRKLRSVCGRRWICVTLTLVATSLVRVSVRRLPVTTIRPSGTAAPPTVRSRLADWPTATTTSWLTVSAPAVAVTSYSPGRRPVSV